MAENINNLLDQEGDLNPNVPNTPNNFEFNYLPDFIATPNTPEFTQLVDPEYQALLNQHASVINRAIKPVFIPSPEGVYSDQPSNLPVNINTKEGKLSFLDNADTEARKTDELKIADPIYSGIRESNFDRYYNHPNFSKLGWHPYANNEAFYNENSSWFDDHVRALMQIKNLAGTGFYSTYRSIGDLFSDDNDYFTGKDLESAREFADAMRIGNSTKGGSFLTNTILQSGYTLGIIANIAVEEAALFGLAAAQGGLNPVSDAAFLARTASNIKRGGSAILNTFKTSRAINATRDLVKAISSAEKAKDFYAGLKATGKFAGNLIAPETLKSIELLNTAKNGATALSGLAKTSKVFGGFYRDLRSLNLALAESKMEGGMNYDQTLANMLAIQKEKNKGAEITDEQLKNIVESATKSAYFTTLINAPVIYFSNQITLGNAFGAYNRTLARVLQDNTSDLFNKMVKSKGKDLTRPFIDGGKGLKLYLNQLKAASLKGSLRAGTHASLRYFSQNLSEGLQEVAQEAITAGTSGYYEELLKNPTLQRTHVLKSAIASALSAQVSEQGLETFLSGFLMGGIVQGPQKLLFQGGSYLYNNTINKEEYKKYKKRKEQSIESLVNTYNNLYEITGKDPLKSIFDLNDTDLAIQTEVSDLFAQALFEGTTFDATDLKDFSKFNAIYKVLETGGIDYFREQQQALLNRTSEELAEAYPTKKEEIKSGKIKERAQSMLDSINRIEENYHRYKDSMPNPYNPSLYKQGEPEYFEELVKKQAFDHVRYLALFTKDGFDRAKERINSIKTELSSKPLFEKMAFSDLIVLLSPETLNAELNLLNQEVEGINQKEDKELYNKKIAKKNKLDLISMFLSDSKNLDENGKLLRDKKVLEKYSNLIADYARSLAKTEGSTINNDLLEETIIKILDYYELEKRAGAYAKSIEFLENPKKFKEVEERITEHLKRVYRSRFETFEQIVKTYHEQNEINTFLNALLELEVYPDNEQVATFIENGKISGLTKFFDENGEVTLENNPEKFMEIQRLINVYKETTKPEEPAESEQDDTTDSDTGSDEGFGNFDMGDLPTSAPGASKPASKEGMPSVNTFGPNASNNPLIKALLDAAYNEYVTSILNSKNKESIKEWTDWVKGKKPQSLITAYESLKILWYNEVSATTQNLDKFKEEFVNDQGFFKWLETKVANKAVQDILKNNNVTLDSFDASKYDQSIDIDGLPTDNAPSDVDDVNLDNKPGNTGLVEGSKALNNFRIYKREVSTETGTEVYYEITDKSGRPVGEDLLKKTSSTSNSFATYNAAEKVAKELDKLSQNTTPFTFGGLTLKYGTVIVNNKGEEFIAIGTPESVQKGNKLFVVSPDNVKKVARRLTEADIQKEGFKIKGADYSKVSESTSKINVSEYTSVYAHRQNESTADAEKRLATILSLLTPEQRGAIRIMIQRNPNAGNVTRNKFAQEGKDENPYIRRVVEPYRVALSISDPTVLQDINNELQIKGIAPIQQEQNIFGYLRTGNTQIIKDGKVITVNDIDADFAENIFNNYTRDKSYEDILKIAQKNYNTQQAFLIALDKMLQGKEKVALTLNELKDFSLDLSSYPRLNDAPKKVSELDYNTVDGVRVLLINERDSEGNVSSRYITDIADPDQAEEFIENLKKDMDTVNPNVRESIETKSQRYVAIIKTPSGEYAGAGLTARQVTEEELASLNNELLQRGIDSRDNNPQEKFDKTYNNIFNKEFNNKIFISTTIPGFTVEINVNGNGSFRIELYDNGKQVKVGYIDTGRIKSEKEKDSEKKLPKKEKKKTKKEEEKVEPKFLDDFIDQDSPTIIEDLLALLNEAIKNTASKSKQTLNWHKIQLNESNVKASFPDTTNIDTVFDSTTATIIKEIRENHRLRLSTSSDLINQAKVDSALNAAAQSNSTAPDVSDVQDTSGPDASDVSAPPAAVAGSMNLKLSDTSDESAQPTVEPTVEPAPKAEPVTAAKFEPLPSDATNEQKKERIRDLKDEIARIENEIASTVPASQLRKTKLNNKDLQDLKAQLNKLNEGLMNKIVNGGFSEKDIADIEEFIQWMKDVLPDFISVEDINTLSDNLKKGVRVGAFGMHLKTIAGKLQVNGTIYTGPKSLFKYHEAFHAVFRLLLTNEQQEALYKQARKELNALFKSGKGYEIQPEVFVKSFKEAYDLLKASDESYEKMSDQELFKTVLEEYMADGFEIFKTKPQEVKSGSVIKNFFNKLLEIIKRIFKRFTTNELENIYHKIDSGKFKGAPFAVANRFTDSLQEGVTVNANKIIPFDFIESETGEFGYSLLPEEVADPLIRGIVSRVLNLEMDNKNSNFSINDAVDQAINEYAELYDLESGRYDARGLSAEKLNYLDQIGLAFDNFNDKIKDAVFEQLKFYDIKDEEKAELQDDNETTLGLRTTDQWDKDASSIGGFASLSQFLRKYIGSTVLEDEDIFGNKYLVDQQYDENGKPIKDSKVKLTISVDFAVAYNGFLKAVKNINDPVTILQQLYFFGQNNPHTKAVVDKLFADLGLQWEGQIEKGELPTIYQEVEVEEDGEKITKQINYKGVKKPLLFQAIIKGFENARIDYIFVHRNKEGKVLTYSAANRDDANTQLDRAAQAYSRKFATLKSDPKIKQEVIKVLDRLLTYIDPESSFVKDDKSEKVKAQNEAKIKKLASQVANVLNDRVGISLSPMFIEYSIVSNLVYPTESQSSLIKAFKNERGFTYEDISQIRTLIDLNKNLFVAKQEPNTSIKDQAARNRLRKLFLANAAFDETVGASVFKNPNGDLVFAHQLPSFHLKKINGLNDTARNGQLIEDLRNSDDYLLNNFLLNNPAFKELSASGMLRALRISGSKKGEIGLNDDDLIVESTALGAESSTYGDFSPKEFLISLLGSYIYNVDNKKGIVKGIEYTEDGRESLAALAPVLLRVLEASNTGDMLALPVIKAVETVNGVTTLTNAALETFFNNIEAEFKRIQKESNPETATEETVVGYNAIVKKNDRGTETITKVDVNSSTEDKNKARGFNFHKTGILLKPAKYKKEDLSQPITMVTSNSKINRINNGTQRILLYNENTAKNIIGSVTEGVIRKAVISDKDGNQITVYVRNLGYKNMQEIGESNFLSLFGENISKNKTETHVKGVFVNQKKYYVESADERSFIMTDKKLYAYEIISEEEALKSQERSTLSFEESLLEAARNPENFGKSLEDILKEQNVSKQDFLEFIKNRLNDEYNEFKKDLDAVVKSDEIPSFISKGVLTSEGKSTSDTEVSNQLYNLKPDNSDYNLKQIFFNDYINTTAINQILLGDTALSLKDAVDEIKRAKAQNASYYSAASVIAAPQYGINKPHQEGALFALTEPLVPSTHNEGTTQNADAQLLMTVKASKHNTFGFGKLTESYYQLYKAIETGEVITADDIFGSKNDEGFAKRQEMLNSQKYVYFDGKVFIKMSAITLQPELTSIKDENGQYTIPKDNMVALHNLRVKMEAFEEANDTVAFAAPRSALKMMHFNVSNIHDVAYGDTPLTNENKMTLDMNYLGLQVINPTNKLEITDITQIKSLVTSEQDDKTEVILDGKPISIGKIKEAYHNATKQRGNLTYYSKASLLFDLDFAMSELAVSKSQGKVTPQLYNYLLYAQQSLGSSNSASHLLELFTPDSSGNPTYNLNSQLTYNKFVSLFLTYFSKGAFKEKLPGTTISLISDYGFRVIRKVYSVDENGNIDRQEVIPSNAWHSMQDRPPLTFNIDEGSYPGNDDNIKGLKEALENSNGEPIYIVDRLRHDLKEYDKDGNYTKQKYSEMMLPAFSKDVHNHIELTGKSIPDVVAKMFAVRVPSQDNHSSMNVKWVDFMPMAYGSSGVFARELVEISGADFDIDKVYTQIKEYYYKEGEFYEYGKKAEDDYEGRFEEYIEYVKKKVKSSKTIYAQGLVKYKGIINKLNVSSEEIKKIKDAGYLNAAKALRALNLPFTLEQYKKFIKENGHEPYEAAINNNILDYKLSLMGNEHVTNRVPLYLTSNAPIGVKEVERKVKRIKSNSQVYEGDITPEPNTIFVFGSNPEGRHGAGAAKIAREQFGAIYGQGEGLQGNAYALPTKDLRVKENKGLKSISPKQITESIKKLYKVAKQNPNKQFKVAYRNTTATSLNGYTGLEMIEMFNQAGEIPSNIVFSKEWVDTGKLNLTEKEEVVEEFEKDVEISYGVTTVNTGIPYLDENGVQKTGVPISYEAADMQVLKDLWTELQEVAPSLAEAVREEGIDVDNMFGKKRMFANNKEGARSIGAVVLPNIYLNLLSEYGIKLRRKTVGKDTESIPLIKFNGIAYDSYSNNYEILDEVETSSKSGLTSKKVQHQGRRTQYILSALITAATDNAKERYLAKLGLNIDALSIVANLTALGVPVKTSSLLINHPVIKQAYAAKVNEGISVSKYIGEVLKSIKDKYSDVETMKIGLTDNTLLNAIENPSPVDSESFTIDDAVVEYNILNMFLTANNLKDQTFKLGVLMSLSGGIGQTKQDLMNVQQAIEDLYLNATDEEFEKSNLMFDVRGIFKSNAWQASYVERFENLVKTLMPEVFINFNENFMYMYNAIINSTGIYENIKSKKLRDKQLAQIDVDLLSFLNIKAYQQKLKGGESKYAASLSNDLIYKKEGRESIVDILDRLKSDEKLASNKFLHLFLIPERRDDADNRTYLDLASANTFIHYNDRFKVEIQNGFAALYSDPYYREDAMALVHYMMVKDGLQYGYKSIVEAVAPIALGNYFNGIDNVQAALKDPDSYKFKQVFGKDFNSLLEEFIYGYLTSSKSNILLKEVRGYGYEYNPHTAKIVAAKDSFNVASMRANQQNLYVFPDNSARRGNTQYRDLDNAVGITLRKDQYSNENSFYFDEEFEDFKKVFDEDLKIITDQLENRTIVLPRVLGELAGMKKFKEASPKIYQYVVSEFNTKLKTTINETKFELKTESKAVLDESLLQEPIYIDSRDPNSSKLVVDLFAKNKKRPEYVVNGERIQKVRMYSNGEIDSYSKLQYNKAKKKAKGKDADKTVKVTTEQSILKKSQEKLGKAGFQTTTIKVNGEDHSILKLPLVVKKAVMSQNKVITGYRYFKLTKIQTPFSQDTMITDQPYALGYYGEYEEIDLEGSSSQNAIGFLFGERPSYKIIREYLKAKNATGIDAAVNAFNNAMEPQFNDADLPTTAPDFSEIMNITAAPGSVTANGKNLSQVKNESKESTNQVNDNAENITSYGSDFARQLTNPSNNLTVEYKGKMFKNAEHAYQTWKSGTLDSVAYNKGANAKTDSPTVNQLRGVKKVNMETSYGTMVEILTAKLTQHPELVSGISERGGLSYILQSTHNVTSKADYWQTNGENKFIEALADAYKNVTGANNNSVESVVPSSNQTNIAPDSENIDVTGEFKMPEGLVSKPFSFALTGKAPESKNYTTLENWYDTKVTNQIIKKLKEQRIDISNFDKFVNLFETTYGSEESGSLKEKQEKFIESLECKL